MAREWTRGDTARCLRVPGAEDDKRTRGVVAVRTGSAEYRGAAVLGVEAAWRAGCGFVRYQGAAADAVLAQRPETVIGAEPDARVDAWVIGSGTDAATRTEDEAQALRGILAGPAPVVVDAGALDLIAGAAAALIVTPHAGEFVRMRERLGLASASPAHGAGRIAQAAEVASATGAVVLLKGARTVIAPPDAEPILVTGAPGWLATAGAGDVLAGVVGAFVAAHHAGPASTGEAVAAAAWLHARAASIAAGTAGGGPGHPIVAMDVAQALPAAVADLLA